MGITVLSLFDGMSVGRIALGKASIEVDKYYSSEIKPYAIEIANKNYPQDEQHRLGDVTKIKGTDLPRIDLFIGGSPCQNLSQANAERLGLDGEKSSLFYEYYRLLQETKPKYFFLENVKMPKADEEDITKLLGVHPIRINSSNVSPALRDRLYWTNIPVTTPITTVGIGLNDILVNGYSDRDKARALLSSDSRPLNSPIKMAHRYFNTGFTTLIFKSKEHYEVVKEHFDLYFKGKSAKEIDELTKTMDCSIYEGVRYMTGEEREMCQTVPVGYTEGITENQRACLLGDGWTTDVIAHIFSHIPKE
jgi:DNA (cytosine-5)-methyltransferase 3A